MGAWGTGILADDTARDIYDDYIDLFNRGTAREEIRAKIFRSYPSSVKDNDEGPLVWLAIAKAQWDCGQLEDEVRARVREIVRAGQGLVRWAEQGERLLQKRKKVLEDFLAHLETVNPQPRKPRKAMKRKPLFQPGDCLGVRLEDGRWGAVLVLQQAPETDDPFKETYGMNLVAGLRWFGDEAPDLRVFEERDWLSLNHHHWRNHRLLFFVSALRFRGVKDRFVRVGSSVLRESDPRHEQCRSYSQWELVVGSLTEQDRWDRGIRE